MTQKTARLISIVMRNNNFEFYNLLQGITVKTCITYKEEDGWYVGHIQEYPNYESQGTRLEELKENLLEIYNDIKEGLVPDAKPSKILELVV